MNRKAGYFKNTQFFYDISHSYNHTCSEIYSSKYLIHLNSVNSNIWKQFNSYLQRIKSSVKQMSQEHFMFFIKYMIRLWIEKKNQSFKKKLSIALTGSLHSSLIIRLFSLSVLVTCPRRNSFVFCLFPRYFWNYSEDLFVQVHNILPWPKTSIDKSKLVITLKQK